MLWAAARITIYRPCKARDVQSPAKFILLIIKCTESMELLPPAPSVGDVPDDVSTVAYDSGDETVDYKGDCLLYTSPSPRD